MNRKGFAIFTFLLSRILRTEGKEIDTIFKQNTFDYANAKSNTDFNGMLVLFLTVSIFLPFYFSLAAVLLIAFMTVINYEKRAETFRDPYSIGIVLFFLFTAFVGQVYNNHVGSAYSIYAAAVLVCGFYVRSFMTKQLFDQVMDTACFSSVACSLVAILQKLATIFTEPSYRPVSTFFNANYYATVVEFVILIAMYRIITNAQNRRFYFIVIGCNLVGLYLSASISAVMALGCAVMVFLFLKGKRRMATAVGAAGLLLAASSLILPEIFPRVAVIDQSWDQRMDIWGTAIKGIQHHPLFGGGAAAYRMACEEFFGYKTYHSHNLYLDTLLNFGLFGAAAIITYLWAQVKMVMIRLRSRVCGNMNILLASVSAAVLVHGFTDVTIFWGQTGMLFLLIFASTGINPVYAGTGLRVPQRVAQAARYLNRSQPDAVYSSKN